jgi:ankyrin repeat protein
MKRSVKNKELQHQLNTAFVICAARGETDIVHCMLRAGADIHAYGDAALMRAAEEGHPKLVEYLLISGADPHGDQALICAARRGQTSTMKVLYDWVREHKPKSEPTHPGSPAP